MRLRQRDLKEYVVKERVSVKEPDGTVYEDWAEEEHTILANMQPAGGKLMAEMYGERLAYMKIAYIALDSDLKETDGVFFDDGIYKVIAVQVWNTHKVAHLEKVIT